MDAQNRDNPTGTACVVTGANETETVPTVGTTEPAKARRTWKTWQLVTASLVALLLGVGSGGASPAPEAELEAAAARSTDVTVTTAAPKKAEEAPTTTTAPPTTAAPTTTAPPPPPTTTTAPPPPTTQAPRASVSQTNAQRSAADYLDYTAFSRTGLIGQLEYEGFSTADATHAVDSLNVDWNEQAAKSAADYLEYTAFSHSGLVDQLVYEGFTPEQAEYGVGTTGL